MAAARCDRPTAGGAAPPAQVHRAAGRVCEAVTASVRVFVLTRSHYRFVLDGKDDL